MVTLNMQQLSVPFLWSFLQQEKYTILILFNQLKYYFLLHLLTTNHTFTYSIIIRNT